MLRLNRISTDGRRFAGATMVAVSLMMPGSDPAAAFTLQESGDWVVSCDNTAACSLVNASQLTQLQVAQPSPFGTSRICIHRRAGPHATAQVFVTLRNRPVGNPASRPETVSVRVMAAASQQSDIVLLPRGAGHWEVPAQAVASLLASLGDSSQLHVVAADGTIVERLSAHGIDQALAEADRAQGRAGTVTAYRAKGTRPASSAASEVLPQPLVTAPLAAMSPAPTPSQEAVRLRRQRCGAPALDATTGYRLQGDQRLPDRILWVTPCDGAQGQRQTYFVIQNEDGSAAPAAFPGSDPERPTGQQGLLALAQLDAATGRVGELWREAVAPPPGRACLIQRQWGWNGRAFELAAEQRSLSCAGVVTGHWPRTYTRQVISPAAGPAMASSFRPPC